jgi:hypothetical protein
MTITRHASAGARRTWLRPAPRCLSGTTAGPDGAPALRPGGKQAARIAAAITAIAALAAAGVAGRAAVGPSFTVLGHLHWLWIPAAVLLESASMAAFAIMLRWQFLPHPVGPFGLADAGGQPRGELAGVVGGAFAEPQVAADLRPVVLDRAA